MHLKEERISHSYQSRRSCTGKGVVIAQNEQEAFDAIASIMEDKIFGESGSKVVIEEFLTGPEVSCLASQTAKLSSRWFLPWITSVHWTAIRV